MPRSRGGTLHRTGAIQWPLHSMSGSTSPPIGALSRAIQPHEECLVLIGADWSPPTWGWNCRGRSIPAFCLVDQTCYTWPFGSRCYFAICDSCKLRGSNVLAVAKEKRSHLFRRCSCLFTMQSSGFAPVSSSMVFPVVDPQNPMNAYYADQAEQHARRHPNDPQAQALWAFWIRTLAQIEQHRRAQQMQSMQGP